MSIKPNSYKSHEDYVIDVLRSGGDLTKLKKLAEKKRLQKKLSTADKPKSDG